MKTVAVLAIGSELLTGDRAETNSGWLFQRLAQRGFVGVSNTVVGDHVADIVAGLRHAAERSDLVVITGGLGPTQDDVTREAVAAYCGVSLRSRADCETAIRAFFDRRGKVMPERNLVQAMIPDGATVLANPRGTAPGFWIQGPREKIAVLPGVPSEMRAMFDDSLAPLLATWGATQRAICSRVIRCFGAGESELESRILDLTVRGRVPEVGITVSDGVISVSVTGSSDRSHEVDMTISVLRDRLGSWVFGEDNDTLSSRVIDTARQKPQIARLATAESCTGGAVARLLTSVAGSSTVFAGGVVAYANEIKEALLEVPKDLMIAHGAVSEPVAQAMAQGARSRLSVDYAVAITGIAGPGGGTEAKPVGTVCVAVASPTGCDSWMLRLGDHLPREEIQSRSANWALFYLLRALEAR